MEPYQHILNTIKSEISLGSAIIHVYQPHEIRSGQVGYSVSTTGKPLSGDRSGDWQKEWLVIGYDGTCGDPLFIDTSKEEYPVYTAMTGKGRWDPIPIAISLQGFANALSAVAALAKGRENPAALEQNPITISEKNIALAIIRQQNPDIEISFWDTLLTEA